MLNRDEDILKAAEDWMKSGHGVALATVVETWGSAPRPAGSSLVINDDGTFLGSVSGGCVEGAVVTEFKCFCLFLKVCNYNTLQTH